MPGAADILLPNHNPRFMDTNRRKLHIDRPLGLRANRFAATSSRAWRPVGFTRSLPALLAMVHIHSELCLSKNIESQAAFSPRCTHRR